MDNMKLIRSQIPQDELLALLAEEATELAHAALKLRRAITKKNPTPVTIEDARAALLEEFADVELVRNALRLNNVKSLRTIVETMNSKEARWVERLNGGASDGKNQ